MYPSRTRGALSVLKTHNGGVGIGDYSHAGARDWRVQALAVWASADGVWQPTIAGASWTSSSFVRASTINRAKSTRRVMLLSRMGSPTCRLHTGRPWLSPSSRSLPRTTVHRASLANTRRHASTWSSRSAKRARRASLPTTFTSALSFHEYTSWPSRVMCHPHENTRRAPGDAWSSTAWAVPVEYPWTP